MKKSILAASAGTLALAGLAWAAGGGGLATGGAGAILLPAANTASIASVPTVRATPAAAGGGFQLASDGKHIVDSYICVFAAGAVGHGAERAEANRSASAAGGSVGHVYQVALQGFSVHASAAGVAQMQARNPRIQYCEQDAVATIIDPVSALARPGSGGGTQPAQTVPFGISRVNGGVDGTGKTAWVIDTGIDLTHPDLNRAPQGNGADGLSANFVARETSANDLNGHGTHVSGTIAAINNGIGVVGVAANAKVVAVRVLDRRGSGAYSDVIAGVDYVARWGHAGDVANMSLGGPVSTALDSAIVNAAKTVTFAVAAGNDGADTSAYSPAHIEHPNVYVVAAISSTVSGDSWASFSNYGATVDFAEPGVSILSTWKDGGYNTISGTSMATPHMAGLLLLGAVKSGGTITRTGASDSYIIGVH